MDEPRRRIAQARQPCDALEHDRADLRKIGKRRKLFARSVASAAHQSRIGQVEFSELDREYRFRVHHRSSCAQKTGPSLQIRAYTTSLPPRAAGGKLGACALALVSGTTQPQQPPTPHPKVSSNESCARTPKPFAISPMRRNIGEGPQ